MSTKFPENIYLNLYIVPTLSASIHTKSKKSLRFGRISIRAKLPIGDWLHPSSPKPLPLGPFPVSGWIDILNARKQNGLCRAGCQLCQSRRQPRSLASHAAPDFLVGSAEREVGSLEHSFTNSCCWLEWDQNFI